jgi:hypothetical protein
MPVLKEAVIVFGIILVSCLFLALGAFLGKALTLGRLAQLTGFIALFAVIIYTVYVSWILLTK